MVCPLSVVSCQLFLLRWLLDTFSTLNLRQQSNGQLTTDNRRSIFIFDHEARSNV